MKFLFVICVAVAIMVTGSHTTVAQMETNVLLKGRVLKGSTPIQADIRFKDNNGNSIRSKSASDGTYQAILKPNRSYDIEVAMDDLSTTSFRLSIPQYDSYTEMDFDLQLAAPAPSVSTTSKKKSKKSKKR